MKYIWGWKNLFNFQSVCKARLNILLKERKLISVLSINISGKIVLFSFKQMFCIQNLMDDQIKIGRNIFFSEFFPRLKMRNEFLLWQSSSIDVDVMFVASDVWTRINHNLSRESLDARINFVKMKIHSCVLLNNLGPYF